MEVIAIASDLQTLGSEEHSQNMAAGRRVETCRGMWGRAAETRRPAAAASTDLKSANWLSSLQIILYNSFLLSIEKQPEELNAWLSQNL